MLVGAWQQRQGRAMTGWEAHGVDRHGIAGTARKREEWIGPAWSGMAARARPGQARKGPASNGKAVEAWIGKARRVAEWSGKAVKEWHGRDGQSEVRHGTFTA